MQSNHTNTISIDFIIRSNNRIARQNFSNSKYANYLKKNSNFISIDWFYAKKNFGAKKKTFKRIKIENKKKVDGKKLFTKEIWKKTFEFYSVNRVEKQKNESEILFISILKCENGFFTSVIIEMFQTSNS